MKIYNVAIYLNSGAVVRVRVADIQRDGYGNLSWTSLPDDDNRLFALIGKSWDAVVIEGSEEIEDGS